MLAVQQDFYARVFMASLTAMLAFPVHEKIVAKHENSKLEYKINWTQALEKWENQVSCFSFVIILLILLKNYGNYWFQIIRLYDLVENFHESIVRLLKNITLLINRSLNLMTLGCGFQTEFS